MDSYSGARAITLTSKELKSRGWTYRLIRAFLDTPDGVRPTPAGTIGRPAASYSIDRVRRVEKSVEFWRAKQQSKARANESAQAVARRQESLTRYAEAVELHMDEEPFEHLLERARREFIGDESVPERSGVHFGTHERVVEMLLKRLEVFDKYLDIYKWHSGIVAAREVFLIRKLDLISATYPVLSAAAKRLRPTQCAGRALSDETSFARACAPEPR